MQKIAESYECKPIEGMLSHQLEQNIIDGEKTIIQVMLIVINQKTKYRSSLKLPLMYNNILLILVFSESK